MKKFNEVLSKVKESDLKVIVEGETYFTVENGEGYRAYCQANVWGRKMDDSHYYQGYDFSTVHKPNRKTGSGWRFMSDAKIETDEDIFKFLDQTLQRSKDKIASGRERMDTRKPHENGLYLI